MCGRKLLNLRVSWRLLAILLRSLWKALKIAAYALKKFPSFYLDLNWSKLLKLSDCRRHENALNNGLDNLEGAMAEEVVPAPAHTSNPAHPLTLQTEVFDGVLKYIRDQIDVSLRNKTPWENMEDKLDNAGVEAKQLPEEFLDAVRVWDMKTMIAMMGKEHQLMLTTRTWDVRKELFEEDVPAVSTIFQLAVLLNSDKMVGEMLRIFICEVRFSPRQLKDLFEQRFEVYGNEISAWDTARVSGNTCILELFEMASGGKPIDFENRVYFAGLEEKQDVCDRLRPILYGQFEEVFKDDSEAKEWLQARTRRHPPTEGTVREMSWDTSIGEYDARWWGASYGISFPRDEDDVFILHWIVGNIDRLFPGFFKIICETLGCTHITSLLKLTDHNGQTPMHILAARRYSGAGAYVGRYEKTFTYLVMRHCEFNFNILYVQDLIGRTCLHYAVAKYNLKFMQVMAEIDHAGFTKFVDVPFGDFGNSRRETTALLLAVKHNSYRCVKMLVKHRCDINGISALKVTLRGPERTASSLRVRAFQMAALAGHIRILKFLLKQSGLYDGGLIDATGQTNWLLFPALHLAAIGGSPLSVKLLLDSGKINPFTISEEYGTALHFVAGWELEDLDMRCASDFVTVRDYSVHMASKKLKTPDANQKGRSLGGIMGCMDMLMQAGLDMEQEDMSGQTPQLMSSASDELSRWWYDKLARQNQEAKTNLVAAANAVSVTAALVATASFVGPLTPPLGFSLSTDAWLTGYSQVNHTALQAFLFCNSLSFYFAIASIMLAVIPSFTIPQEGLPLEVRIASRVVQVAVVLLFLSIAFVICAFSAATIAVVPESRWHYKVLAVVSTILGSLVCLIALCLFLLRLMRLITPNAVWVRTLTNSVFFPFKKRSRPGHSDTAVRDTFAKWVRSLKNCVFFCSEGERAQTTVEKMQSASDTD